VESGRFMIVFTRTR